MHTRSSVRVARLALAGLCAIPLSGLGSPAVEAKRRPASVAGRHTAAKDGGRYFVEFRSRYALSYGHTFLVHGRLNARGEVGELTAENVAGFHPAGRGSELWTVGHVLPVPAETGPSDGDLEEQYVSARYRVLLGEAEYMRVRDRIKQMQANPPPWHAVAYNCSAWAGDVARYMGLKVPGNHLLFPDKYINELRRLNTGQAAFTSSAAAEPYFAPMER